ncbi:MAG: hypothetical protein H8E17_12630 [Deltaproteobacteria bacterium]|nr:hypothetical protein [Deltaproteobacteria bacterium]
MKKYVGLAQRVILYKVFVSAKTKTEAIRKIRKGEIDGVQEIKVPGGFSLSGGGHENVKEFISITEIKEGKK